MNRPTERNSDGNLKMDDVGRLIKLVGARDAVSDERLERARRKVRSHWEQVVAEQRAGGRLHRFKIFTAVASVAVLMGTVFVLWNLNPVQPTDSLASVERVVGEVTIAGGIARRGSSIDSDYPIITDKDSRMALRMSGGQSLRIDAASHVTMHSPNHISLEAGAIYIDTTSAASEEPILVSTPLGQAQDIGTQFQVRVTGMMLVVGVRQGLVEVVQPGRQSLSINKGYYMELSAAGESGKHPLQPDDPDWDWIESVAPEFDIQGETLERYLLWYAQESGLELVWADGISRTNAGKALLAGSIAGTSLDEGLLLVKQVAPFEYRISSEGIWVRVK